MQTFSDFFFMLFQVLFGEKKKNAFNKSSKSIFACSEISLLYCNGIKKHIYAAIQSVGPRYWSLKLQIFPTPVLVILRVIYFI